MVDCSPALCCLSLKQPKGHAQKFCGCRPRSRRCERGGYWAVIFLFFLFHIYIYICFFVFCFFVHDFFVLASVFYFYRCFLFFSRFFFCFFLLFLFVFMFSCVFRCLCFLCSFCFVFFQFFDFCSLLFVFSVFFLMFFYKFMDYRSLSLFWKMLNSISRRAKAQSTFQLVLFGGPLEVSWKLNPIKHNQLFNFYLGSVSKSLGA